MTVDQCDSITGTAGRPAKEVACPAMCKCKVEKTLAFRPECQEVALDPGSGKDCMVCSGTMAGCVG